MGYRFPPDTMDELLGESRSSPGKMNKNISLELDTIGSSCGSNRRLAVFSKLIRERGRMNCGISCRKELPLRYPSRCSLHRALRVFCRSAEMRWFWMRLLALVLPHKRSWQLNRADGGSRRFILIEDEDYADTLTAERIRRVIKGVPKAQRRGTAERPGRIFLVRRGGPSDAIGDHAEGRQIAEL